MLAVFVSSLLSAITHNGVAVPLLWIVGAVLVIAGVISLVRGSILGGILLIIVGIVLGGLNVF